MACVASTNSSVLRWLSLLASAALSAGGLDWSWAFGVPLWAKALPAPIRRTRPVAAKWRKTAFLNSSTRRPIHSPICFLPEDNPRRQSHTTILDDNLTAARRTATLASQPGLLPSKWVPNAAATPADSHDGYFGFCPANSQLYRVGENLSQDKAPIAFRMLLADH